VIRNRKSTAQFVEQLLGICLGENQRWQQTHDSIGGNVDQQTLFQRASNQGAAGWDNAMPSIRPWPRISTTPGK